HSDVGGGYFQTGLSDLALEWMIAKARAVGLHFDDAAAFAHPLQPDPHGELHNSKKGLYRVTAGLDRSIGLVPRDPDASVEAPRGEDSTQSLHPSVRRRWNGTPRYRPNSLIEYFRRIGEAQGEETRERVPAVP
ncbi:MAG: hypothetical protein ACRD2Z_07510, partial [Thermoanaerobaculia bacterium]